MKTPFHQQCLEISERAMPGPWKCKINHTNTGNYPILDYGYKEWIHKEDAEFIAASRTLLPECARRLARGKKNVL